MQKHEAGIEGKRVQGCEERGLQGNTATTPIGMARSSDNCGPVENRIERTSKSLEG